MNVAFQIESQSVVLLSQRAVFLPQDSTLLIGDLHLGKGDHLAMHGAPIPQCVNRSVLNESFSRLEAALDLTASKRLIVLGDVIHASTGLTDEVVELACIALKSFQERGIELIFVKGNHDRGLAPLADYLQVTLVPSLSEGPFTFVHDPAEAVLGSFTFCGHLHPAIPLGDSGAPRLPAFWRRRDMCVLPAFSRFTGGLMPRVEYGDDLYIIADDQVIHRRIAQPSARAVRQA